MEIVELLRVYLPGETLGSMFYKTQLIGKSMELPNRGNKRGISCIPEGIYEVTKEPPIPENDPSGRKARNYWHFRVHNVPGRSGILIHTANYVRQLKGCIAPGGKFIDLDMDGQLDVEDSGKTLRWMVANLPDRFILEIREKSKVAA